MDNSAIKGRWETLKINRFSDLANIGHLDEIDLMCNEAKCFFDSQTFINDYYSNYKPKSFTIKSTNPRQELLINFKVLVLENINKAFLFDTRYSSALSFSDVLNDIWRHASEKYPEIEKLIIIPQYNFHDDVSLEFPYEIVEFNLEKVLDEMQLSDEIKNRYLSIEETYKKKIKIMYSSDLDYFLNTKDYRDALIRFFADYIFKNQTIYSDESAIKSRIINYLSDKNKKDYLYLLFTCIYTSQTIEKLDSYQVDLVDFAYAALPMFKIIEKTLYNILLIKYSNSIYKDGKTVANMEENKMMLSDMALFLKQNHFFSNSFYNTLKNWILFDRNGYAHKHIMSKEKYEDCCCNSFNLFVKLID